MKRGRIVRLCTVLCVAAVARVLLLFPGFAGADDTLNLSRDLVTRGISSTNLIPNQPSLDAGPFVRLARP